MSIPVAASTTASNNDQLPQLIRDRLLEQRYRYIQHSTAHHTISDTDTRITYYKVIVESVNTKTRKPKTLLCCDGSNECRRKYTNRTTEFVAHLQTTHNNRQTYPCVLCDKVTCADKRALGIHQAACERRLRKTVGINQISW